MSDSNPKLERFNESRKTFVASLNSVSILSLLVFLTIFVPYTTYVGNLLATRVEIKKETKMVNGQVKKINIEPKGLDDNKEAKGKFDLKALEEEWLKAHNPSVNVKEMLSGSTEFNNPAGTFSFSKPEIVLIYPSAISILLVYLSLQFYDLLNLKRKLKNEDEELVKIPWWRIAIPSIFLVLCLGCSWFIIVSRPQIPEENTSQLVKIESRLGKIIAKESSYQLTPDIDLWIFFPSLVLLVISGVITFNACKMSKK
jgi:amino acid transporter